jgi:hypothetical protein
MEYWVLYLCSIADSVHTLLMVLGIIGGILSAIIFVMSICSSQCDECSCRVCLAKGVKKAGIKRKYVIVPAFIIMMLAVLTPSTNQCYAIFGVGATLHYVNHSEEVQKIPDNAMKAVNRYLESLAPNDSIQ